MCLMVTRALNIYIYIEDSSDNYLRIRAPFICNVVYNRIKLILNMDAGSSIVLSLILHSHTCVRSGYGT